MAEHVCPWWIGYLLASPIRRLFQKPEDILANHVSVGMTVLDVGCAMGYFTLPMARMVGAHGKVVCVDMQQRMLDSLHERAVKAGVPENLELRQCAPSSLGIEDLEGEIDFALAFAMVHEAGDPAALFGQIYAALAPGASLVVAEPRGHVTAPAFEASLGLARNAGFVEVSRPKISRSHAVLLRR